MLERAAASPASAQPPCRRRLVHGVFASAQSARWRRLARQDFPYFALLLFARATSDNQKLRTAMPSHSYRDARNAAQAREFEKASADGCGTGSLPRTPKARSSAGGSRAASAPYDSDDDEPVPYRPLTPSDYVSRGPVEFARTRVTEAIDPQTDDDGDDDEGPKTVPARPPKRLQSSHAAVAIAPRQSYLDQLAIPSHESHGRVKPKRYNQSSRTSAARPCLPGVPTQLTPSQLLLPCVASSSSATSTTRSSDQAA